MTQIYADKAALMAAAADLLTIAAQHALSTRGRWTFALAGGSTPRGVYQLLATAPRRDAIDWSRTYVFWGDERCVPPTDAQSNYRMAMETLLSHVPIPEANVFRMQGEDEPQAAVAAYAQQLQQVFNLQAHERPVFDTILLGMGPDGHTASLFPNTALLAAEEPNVVVGWVPQQQQQRISLTLPVLNAARGVIFLVAGADKAPVVQAVLEQHDQQYPAARVQPAAGAQWLLDQAAASALTVT